MHIDQLIQEIKPNLPFKTESDVQDFLNNYHQNDQIALISALYFGASHLYDQKVNPTHWPQLQSGTMNRFWENDMPANRYATTLFEKSTSLVNYYDAFLRVTTNSGYDRRLY